MTEGRRHGRLWTWTTRLLPTFVAVGVLVWALDRIGWSTIGEAVLSIGVAGALGLVTLGVVETCFDALALRAGLRAPIARRTVLSANASGALLNWLIPWEAGEALKLAILRRFANGNDVATAVVLWNYAFKWTRPAVALLAALVGASLSPDVSSEVRWAVILACVLSTTPYWILRAVFASGICLRITAWVLRRIFNEERSERFQTRISNLHEGVRTFRKQHPRRAWWLAMHQMSARIVAWMTLYLTARLMGLDYSFSTCSLAYATLSVVSYLTVIIPARIGVSEGAAFVAFELLGLSGEYGLLLALILRIKALIANGIGAVPGSFSKG